MDDGASSELQRLLDRQAVVDLLIAYCQHCDRNDADAVAACFTVDCVADYGPGVGPPERGREARRTAAARDLALFAATSHHLSNVTVSFESPDRARTSSVLYAWHRPVGGTGSAELWARYEDVVVRTPKGWLIHERRMLVAGSEGFPAGWEWLPVERLPTGTW